MDLDDRTDRCMAMLERGGTTAVCLRETLTFCDETGTDRSRWGYNSRDTLSDEVCLLWKMMTPFRLWYVLFRDRFSSSKMSKKV